MVQTEMLLGISIKFVRPSTNPKTQQKIKFGRFKKKS